MGVAGLFEGIRARSGERSLLDRLDDVRGRLIRAALVLLVGVVAGFLLVVNFDVLGVLTAPIQPYLPNGRLGYLSPTDPFFVTLKLAGWIGLLLALPYLLVQLWAAVSPLLLPDEKRLFLPAMAAGVTLFVIGVVFCYVMVLPLMLQFTMGFQSQALEQSVVIGEYLKIVLRLMIAFGLAFQLPIAVLMATLLRIVTPDFLASKRRHAIATLTIASAIITPPDLSSQVLLVVPVWFLFELSIIVSRVVLARRAPAVAIPEV